MTDLPEEPDRSADDGDDDAAPASTAGASRGRRQWVAVAVVAALAIVATAGIAAAMAGDGGDDAPSGDPAPRDDAGGGTEPAAGDAGDVAGDVVVAVTFGEGSIVGDPVDLELRFLDGGGEVLATRSWREVEERIGAAPSDPSRWGGLLQSLPAGELQLEATLQQTDGPVSCTQPFTVGSHDRLILRLEEGPLGDRSIRSGVEVPCARVEPVDEWAGGATGPTGQPYVGLAEDEAVARAESEGLTTRVVGVDGVHLVVTMDLRPDRLNLMLFDGVVVAAQLDAEAPA
jgi:hypothetical protein